MVEPSQTALAASLTSIWHLLHGQRRTPCFLGLSGEQVTEMAVAGNTMKWQHTNVYAAGTLLATHDTNGLHFYLNDPLGTRRAQTDYAGVLEQTCSNLWPAGTSLTLRCWRSPWGHSSCIAG